jgi:elongation factor 1-beta
MKALETTLRSIEMDGLTWGASKLVPLAFGIKKLQVNLVVEDEKVSIDELQAKIEADEDHVQSTDVVSFFSPMLEWTLQLTKCVYLGCYAKAIE